MPQFSRFASKSSLTVGGRRKGILAAAYKFQGTVSGYSSGGLGPPSAVNTIDKFPFASDSNATDVGDLTQARRAVAGQSSSVSGYTSGGGTTPVLDTIDKFPFASDANATDVGDLTLARRYVAGQSSADNGYASGGRFLDAGLGSTIDKFPFASDANATDVGDLRADRGSAAGQSSGDNGYVSGGNTSAASPGNALNTIDKFSFASDGNATDVGDLSQSRGEVAGQSSTDSGYTTGGLSPPWQNTIDKFPFASDANATDVGDLSQARGYSAGQSSTVNGYCSGGEFPTSPNTSSSTNIIDKFPFASNRSATDVGNLTQARQLAAGQQV